MGDKVSRRGAIVAEGLVVVAVAAMVAGAWAWRWGAKVRMVKVETARAQVTEFCKALWRFHSDVGDFPADMDGLAGLVVNPGAARWRGPYLAAARVPKDPWGGEYLYLPPGSSFGWYNVFSAGPDRRFGTADDIGIRLGRPIQKRLETGILLAGRGSRALPGSGIRWEVSDHEAAG